MDERIPDEREERQPEAEERRREPAFNLPSVILALIAVCVGVHLLRVYVFGAPQDAGILLRFAFIPARYSGQYAFDLYALISPLTYAFLHGGALHLAINMIWLAAFGTPLANRIGAARFLAFWAATSLGAALLHYVMHPLDVAPVIGASGAVSGMMGAAARFAFRIDRSSGRPAFAGPVLPIPLVLRSRAAVVFLAVWMVVNLVTGLASGGVLEGPQIAWEAHIGGFIVGFFGIFLFDRRADPPGDGDPD